MGLLAGVALSPNAKPEAGMGIDLDDYDGDGRFDIVITNFDLESLGLRRNLGDGLFQDTRFVAKLAEPSLLSLGFGIDFLDLDLDGDLDLLVANGHVGDVVGQMRQGAQFAQRNQVYENLGNGTFAEALDTGMDLLRVSRGLATGDLDGDGDLDAAILATNELAEVWESTGEAKGAFLLVDVGGSSRNTFAIGAHVTVAAGGRTQLREVRTGNSYLSQHAMSSHFGLGAAERVERLVVRWPDGRTQAFFDLPARRRVRVVGESR